ncbi:MAG TPA: hypothetical protein VMN56_17930 [Casimicrobiaceae bacterium]|nr:hypothetical protein [Casimicrobiaceae bacterium]
MTRPLLVALLAVNAAALAQSPTPAPPAGDKDAAAQPRTASDGPPSSQDPRVCLEFPTREQVIACAEKYRPRRHAPKA